MRTFSIKYLFVVMNVVAVFFGGWAVGFISWDMKIPTDSTFRDPVLIQEAAPVTYDPATFKEEIESLIENKEYATAIALLDDCPVDQQIEYEGTEHYFAVAGYAIDIPGTNGFYERERDWILPGTSDVIKSKQWQDNAFRFAKKYNRRVDQLKSKKYQVTSASISNAPFLSA